jgi:hypothetical protein
VVFFHPDYPLLLPMLVSNMWFSLGSMSSRAPILIAGIYTLSVPLLTFAAVRVFRDTSQAAMAGILMISAPHLFKFGSGQTADIPLAAYVFAAIVLLVIATWEKRWQFITLAGLMAGCGGWTKNEGLMFLMIITISFAAISIRGSWRNGIKQMIPWVAGLIIPLMTILFFKSKYAPPSEMFTPLAWNYIFDGSRYLLIFSQLGSQLLYWGGWAFPALPAFLLYGLLLHKRVSGDEKKPLVLICIVTLLSIAGFFGIYLITPYDLLWHLTYSADRLMFQIYPIFILGLMLCTVSVQNIFGPFHLLVWAQNRFRTQH